MYGLSLSVWTASVCRIIRITFIHYLTLQKSNNYKTNLSILPTFIVVYSIDFALYVHLLVDSMLRPLTVLLRNVNWFLIFLRYVWMTTQAFIMRAFDLSVVHENIMRIAAQISCELLTLWLWNITITILHFLIYRNNYVFVGVAYGLF